MHQRTTMLAHCNLKQNSWLCSKQSSFFYFYALPSGGKLKDSVVHWKAQCLFNINRRHCCLYLPIFHEKKASCCSRNCMSSCTLKLHFHHKKSLLSLSSSKPYLEGQIYPFVKQKGRIQIGSCNDNFWQESVKLKMSRPLNLRAIVASLSLSLSLSLLTSHWVRQFILNSADPISKESVQLIFLLFTFLSRKGIVFRLRFCEKIN